MDERVTAPVSSSMDQVPALGYRNYWYPAMRAGRLGKRPQHVKLLGDDVVLFRDRRSRTPYAMADRCPHRNAPLSDGDIFFPGTLSCPYHGWTFDTDGNLVAVLTEGPDCPLVGKVRQPTYPVREFRGFIWIWMGDGAPVPLEDDLPPEISDPSTSLFSSSEIWNANWRPVTENTDGYHAPILHYNSMPRVLFMSWVAWRRTTYVETDDKLGLIFAEIEGEDETHYPDLGDWPPYPAWKLLAKKLFRAKTARGRPIDLPNGKTGRITEDIHLPGWRRVRVRGHTVLILWAVPVDRHTTRHFLWDAVLQDPFIPPGGAGPITSAMWARTRRCSKRSMTAMNISRATIAASSPGAACRRGPAKDRMTGPSEPSATARRLTLNSQPRTRSATVLCNRSPSSSWSAKADHPRLSSVFSCIAPSENTKTRGWSAFADHDGEKGSSCSNWPSCDRVAPINDPAA
jgi:nitrite reductase/ring-hydroxylating ferredoxin subunit